MVKYNDFAKHIHRLPPCPVYDVEAFQSWLSDMAQQGYLLDRDGFFMGFASFEVAQPCRILYRLQPAAKAKSAFDDGEPDPEEARLSEAMGWDYVARYQDFHIYRCTDPQARELNTDPDVQALALKKVTRRMRSNLLLWLFWLIFYPLITLDCRLLLTTVVLGTWFVVFVFLVYLWLFISSVRKIRMLRRIQKRLRLGDTLQEYSDWKNHRLRNHIFRLLDAFMWVAFAVALIAALIAGLDNSHKMSLDEYGAPPFATIADFCPHAEYESDRIADSFGWNTVEVYETALVPHSCHWRESADLRYDDKVLSASYYIYYHEAAAPWLAKLLAYEHQMEDRLHRDFEEVGLSVPGADYTIAWRDEIHLTHVIIQKGNIVAYALFNQYNCSIDFVELEEWTAILANSIE